MTVTTIDALLCLPRVEVDKCKILSRRANAFVEKNWLYILQHYVEGDLIYEVTNAYHYIGPGQIPRTSPIDSLDPEIWTVWDVSLDRYRNMNRAEGWTEYSDELTKLAMNIVKFAKRLRGFRTFEQAEQMRLLKKHMFVMLMISVSRYYNSDAGLLSISGGRALPVNTFACSDEGDRQFAHDVINGIETMANMQLTKAEVGLFASFALLRESPQSQTHVAQIKTALMWQLSHRLSPSQIWELYGRLTHDILPFFEFLSGQHIDCVARLQSLNSTEMQLPQLYKELFVADSR